MPMQISGVTIQGGMNILPRAGAPSPSPTPGPSPAPGPSDPDFSNVVFMFDGDGTDGGANNAFTDSSTNGHAITETGSVIQGSFSPYGDNWSNYFDGNDHLNTPPVTFGTNNFTIEAWVMFDNASATQNPIIVLGNDGYNDWQLDTASSNIRFQHTSGNFSGTTTLQDNTWYHVAVVREGTGTNQIKIYLNGALEATSTVSENFDGTGNIKIARNRGNSYYMSGYISNVRLVNGTAVYTSAFTPSTAPLTAISGTSLLTCQSNRFVDESTNNHTVTVNGDPEVTPFSPFAPTAAYSPATRGGSGLFATGDGTTNNLTATVNAIGTNNFTIEMWLYNTEQNNQPILDLGGYQDGISIRYDQSGTDRISGYIKGAALTYVNDPTPNQWIHFALTRSGSTVKAFYNGIQTLSTTDSSDLTRTNLKIGGINSGGVSGNDSYTGYMSDVRIVIGDALYTTDFTPPTAPLTAVTNTELLLGFQDSAIYDYSGLNNIDTVGNAQIDTAIKKYGTGSVKFDGSGDYLIAGENPDLAPGAGDFTVEFWMYGVTNTFYNGLYQNYTDGVSRTTALRINTNVTDQTSLMVQTAATGLITTASGVVTANAWNHVALVRNGSSLVLYVNGVSAGSTTNTTDFSDGYAVIGNAAYNGTNYFFNGYLDDLRITKGAARYTSNFTPPTAALPKF